VVEAEAAHLHLLRPGQVAELAVAAARADELAADDEMQRTELAYWVGGPHPPGTGLPPAAIPTQPPHNRVPERDFGQPGTLAILEGGDQAAAYAVIFGEPPHRPRLDPTQTVEIIDGALATA
jgi:hypothetical protein